MGKVGVAFSVTGAIIATQSKTVDASHVASSTATLVEYATADEALVDAAKAQADAALADRGHVEGALENHKDVLTTIGMDVMIGQGVGLRNSNDELRERFDAAICSMRSDAPWRSGWPHIRMSIQRSLRAANLITMRLRRWGVPRLFYGLTNVL